MKWFVTDAQLAQLRITAELTVRATCNDEVHRVREMYDAEIQRLREDRAAEVARLTDPQGPLVQHYEREVTFWRRQFLSERQRADIAIDQCRITHQQIGPVTLPPREDRLPREFPASEEQALASLNIDGL